MFVLALWDLECYNWRCRVNKKSIFIQNGKQKQRRPTCMYFSTVQGECQMGMAGVMA